jgi:hypothetical protein
MLSIDEVLNIGQFILMWIWVFIAAKWLYTWKNQLQGKDEYLVAKWLLKSTYNFRDKLKNIRIPFVSVHEFWETPINGEHSKSFYEMQWAYVNRTEKLDTARKEITDFLLDAEAIWWNDIVDLYKKLFEQQHTLYSHVWWYLDSFIDKSYKDIYDKDILYDFNKQDNSYTSKSNEIFEEIESSLKKYLK